MKRFLIFIIFLSCILMTSCTRKINDKVSNDIKNDTSEYNPTGKTEYSDNNSESIPKQRKKLNEYGANFNGDIITIITRDGYRIDPFSDEYTFSDRLQRQKEMRMIEDAYNCKLQIISNKYLRRSVLDGRVQLCGLALPLAEINYAFMKGDLAKAEERYNYWSEQQFIKNAVIEEKSMFQDLAYSNPTFYYSPMFEDLFIYNETMGFFEMFSYDEDSMKHLYNNQYFNDADKLLFSNIMFLNEYKPSGGERSTSSPILNQIPADEVPLINLAMAKFNKSSAEYYSELEKNVINSFLDGSGADLIKSIDLSSLRKLLNIDRVTGGEDLVLRTTFSIPSYAMAVANYNGLTAKTVDDISDDFVNLLVDSYLEYGRGYALDHEDRNDWSPIQFFSNYVEDVQRIGFEGVGEPYPVNLPIDRHEFEETDRIISVCSPYIFDKKEESVIPSTYYSYKIIAPFLRANNYKMSDMVDLMTDLSMAFIHDPKVEYEKLAYANRNNQKTLNYIEKIKDMDYSFDYNQLLTIGGLRTFSSKDFVSTGEFTLHQSIWSPEANLSQLIYLFALLGGGSETAKNLFGIYYDSYQDEFQEKFLSLNQRERAEHLIREQVTTIKRISLNVNNYFKKNQQNQKS